MITLEDYLMGRDKKYPLDEEQERNARITLDRVNMLLDHFREDRKVTSGYRPKEINALTPGASPGSKHITCEAIDLADDDRRFGNWCMENLPWLSAYGLWMEHLAYTVEVKDSGRVVYWVHLQIVPPKSGNRVFIPRPGPPPEVPVHKRMNMH